MAKSKDCKMCGTGSGLCVMHAMAGAEENVGSLIFKAFRMALEKVVDEELAEAEKRIKERAPDVVARFALELSQQTSFSFGGRDEVTVRVNLDGLPKVVDLDGVTQELWSAFGAEAPPPGAAQIGQVKAVLRRYGVGR